jgi:hypothetical protein
VAPPQLNYLLTALLPAGTELEERSLPEGCADFLDERAWKRILELATFDCFESLPEDIERQPDAWRTWMQADTKPGASAADGAPSPYSELETPQFASILLRRALKPARALGAMKRYVERALGPSFVRPSPPNLKDLFDARSRAGTPMLLLLTAGNDPMEAIARLGEERLKGRLPLQVSLGRGQAVRARALVGEARAYGGWVVL